jgi:hypothetical protein
VQLDLLGGALGLWLTSGKVHDQRAGITSQALPAGALHLRDLGYFNLQGFAQDEARGVFYLSRYKGSTLVYTRDAVALDVVSYLQHRPYETIDLPILLGAKHLACRLIAFPIPEDKACQRRQRLRETARRKQQPLTARSLALAGWTILITNIPPALLTPPQALFLLATRWQIECLFKLWKSCGLLADSRSHDPDRVLGEFYAKLLALLVQHWVTVVACWHRLDHSLYQALQVMHKRAFSLLDDLLTGESALIRCLHKTTHVIASTCGMSKRASHPLTFQAWIEVAYD